MSTVLKMLPPTLRQLLEYVSPATLKIISIREILALSKSLIQNSRDKSLAQEIFAELQTIVNNSVISQQDESNQGELKELPDDRKEAAGEAILELYFQQFLNTKGFFIDLRPKKIGTTASAPFIQWHVSLPFVLDEEFRQSIVQLYQSFYGQQDDEFEDALLNLNLIEKNWQQERKDQLKGLLIDHFGSSLEGKVTFTMDMFYTSSHNLFSFLKDNGVEVDRNFLVFGIYLVCLYLALDELQVGIDVQKVVANTLLDK
ncbi:hypothetical protein [Pseudobacteriovorax antillogorgiicola]|uniref:Uncharacterized protein n=1 Tax=Pseudobacteriovorax antillogorgiicola TaxID=1513793 RepID=A0A1Y6BJT2_9BACT|nr:hypothetical protein [Pseudobacteriovorax antillogorgiicola]TCS55508.1 hypothetical protein EDD56_105231 [Pseudobacteriovorax antillogorgiicola]SMF11509.1 hypothetical protein SAMN06296036_10593 [Pseudobacteriovorax antillogorgiicola]